MPPWLPKQGDGDFVGARQLSDQELQAIRIWVDAGMPMGKSAAMPSVPKFVDPWSLDAPDLVIETPEYKLEGQDRDVFRNFVVPLNLDSARWIKSIELRPTNPPVTHHARLGIDASGESARREGKDGQPGYDGMAWGQDPDGQLVIWAPGMSPSPDRAGVAWRLYPQTCLVLHAHLQPSGKPESVRFRVGIRFAQDAPELRPALLRIGSCDIDIPAGTRNHTVTDRFTLPIDVDVHTIFPHAHSLCQNIRVVAELPSGTKQSLMTIEQFDENWHDSYRYRQPVRLPRGTKLVSTFVYDNSDSNIRNRNHPARRVVYGSNVTDEMADVYLQVTPVRHDQREVLMEDYRRYELQSQTIGIRRTLELDPNNPWSQEALATCYFGLGEPGKAISVLEERLKRGPVEVFPIVSLGMAHSASGDASRAEAQFQKAVAIDDKYPLAWFGLGKALTTQNKLEPAEHAYRRAIELSPGMTDARMALADLLIKRGQLDEAEAICIAALTDSPDMANLYLKVAEIHVKQKNFDESMKYCQKANHLAPYIHPPKVLLGVFCFANGDRERGRKLLEEARVDLPGHPVAFLLLGQLERQENHLPAAREYLLAAATLSTPDNWPASHKKRFGVLLHSERFQLAQQTHDLDLARIALTDWINCEPENRQLQKLLDQISHPR